MVRVYMLVMMPIAMLLMPMTSTVSRIRLGCIFLPSLGPCLPVPLVVFRHSKKLPRQMTIPRSIYLSMIRPCFLVIDREHSGSISTRKLVIESAKFNVVTAYSGAEALETFERFPNIDGVVLNATIHDVPCEQVVATVRGSNSKLPIIVVQGPGAQPCPGASHFVDSFDPASLLELLHQLFPRATQTVKQQDDRLKAEENRS